MTRLLPLAFLLALPMAAQNEGRATYRTELGHPRLLLPQRRLSLLQKERDRESMRWIQFQTLVAGKISFPEPGYAWALYSLAAKSEPHAKQATEWAIGSGTDLRQLALVYDWCFPALGPNAPKLAAKIKASLEKTASAQDIGTIRARVLAALAITDEEPDLASNVIKQAVEVWWKAHVLGVLAKGDLPFKPSEHLALFELLHALRDNFDIDLRETSAKFFTTLPAYHILAHYPAPFPAPENEYRIPLMTAHAEPDVREAARTRAAALAMVAYDNNAQEMQFVQGWLIQDKFLMRSPYGIPYEFMWANPYQPGLSFHYLPNIYHDPVTGRLIIRSTWEDDAVWYYQAGGVTQMFQNGQIANVQKGAIKEPVTMGNTVLMPPPSNGTFNIATEEQLMHYYLIGLDPTRRYDLEVDDEEIREVKTDRGGVLELKFPPKRTAAVGMHPSPQTQQAR
ncbi:MAG: hypothetical protein U0Q16_25525 [Bryobacteraceae bacterium]